MMETETVTGADAGETIADYEAAQTAAEAETPTQDEAAEPAPSEPEVAEEAKPEREPLTPEEYQKRHDNINQALKQERTEKRQLRSEIDTLRAELADLRQGQPQQFQQFTLDQQIAQYQNIDWQAWAQSDPVAANQAALELQGLVNQKESLQQQAAQAEQQRQQQAQQQHFAAFQQAVDQSEAEYLKIRPDYNDAVAHLRDNLRQEANGQGWFGPQADAYAQNQIIQIGLRVHTSGMDLAEFAYNEAMRRGYKPPVADIASVKAGEQAARTISGMGAKGAANTTSIEETAANLNGAALRDYWNKVKSGRA